MHILAKNENKKKPRYAELSKIVSDELVAGFPG